MIIRGNRSSVLVAPIRFTSRDLIESIDPSTGDDARYALSADDEVLHPILFRKRSSLRTAIPFTANRMTDVLDD
ncbi:hypothetical protein KL930_000736 [Ogataea haglerorum]|uniref:Uncharacterized protein n=1 Tax=Ogataea haglerorum TaxID=1937702 RepID=A0AAN6I3P0_9ASCO|nr:uncharacterized protein KL911_003419 [Ogataea haglerorum]KAG7700049.1 hypothetical protein KL915_000738 [Ogataea haglerorum]KAG7701707.1 hypothetical protein KL951_000163 [Ogataea haglerorum]KAG7711520.1 hypothetical protein KL914_000162 [Ogataea haglerorum]KAG7712291.1 hypothetical protein KL950_000162 [Ogataea haglerorum]KAG7722344.1 hypothetical protein KL913_000164 [Ogataea haglerorum]